MTAQEIIIHYFIVAYLKTRAEDAFGKVEDTEMNKKYTELKHQVLMLEKREVQIVAREKALLREKEEAQRRVSKLFSL